MVRTRRHDAAAAVAAHEEVLDDDLLGLVVARQLLPEGEAPPSMDILFNSEIRKLEKRLFRQYTGGSQKAIVDLTTGEQKAEININIDRSSYTKELLKKAYINSSGIFENPSKELILAAIDEKSAFAEALAEEIAKFFRSKDAKIKQREEEDKKK